MFYECIGGQLEQIIKKNANSHENKYMKNEKKKQNFDHLKLPDMILIKKLGFGQFGSVYLVKNKVDKKLYGLKCIMKSQIVEQSLEKHLLQEKRVLESVQFPLIMQFIRALKDDNNIYFVVEYIKGLELFDVIRDIGIDLQCSKLGLLNTYDSQFYIGSLILCMEYLHTHSIIYRDIKPENIMVDH
jgi:cGMP-dependent protein kinase